MRIEVQRWNTPSRMAGTIRSARFLPRFFQQVFALISFTSFLSVRGKIFLIWSSARTDSIE